MELELQRTCLNGFQMILNRTVVQEETLESVVADTCPDIMRIVDVNGQACMTAREPSAGSLRMSGTVRASVIYIPEGENGPRHAEVQIPFLCTVDDPALHGGCKIQAVPRICGIDARAVNPRKVLTRVEVAVDIRVYAPDQSSACTEASCGKGADGVQQKMEHHEVYQVYAVQEKNFTFSDVLNLPVSKPRAKELLHSRVEPRNLEAKVIGSKLVLKGEVELTVLYSAQEGGACANRFQVPYSQIIELGGAEDESDVTTECAVCGMDCSLQPGEPGAVAVTMELLVQVAVWKNQRITLLSDLYCTSCPLEVEYEAFSVNHLIGGESRRESVRQFCECGIPAKTVVDAVLSIGRVERTGHDGDTVFRAGTAVTVMFLSEDDALCSVTYPIPVESRFSGERNCEVTCRCTNVGELLVVPVTGGLEVRFELDFSFLAARTVS